MAGNVKQGAAFIKHPINEGVFMKHFYGKEETGGQLSNVEVVIIPGFLIAEHVHDSAGEFFYLISGSGEFLDESQWRPVKAGDAFKAPQGMKHSIKNTGSELMRLLCTFSPPIR
jgi:quercetin dioxygenase-like cupin family protein